MIELNHFHHLDTTSLEQYLHDQAMKGYHIKYVSGLFLWFKKVTPASLYYTVIPDIWRVKGITAEKIPTSLSYNVYVSSEHLEVPPIQKKQINIFFLFLLPVVAIIVLISLFDIKEWHSSLLMSSSYLLLYQLFRVGSDLIKGSNYHKMIRLNKAYSPAKINLGELLNSICFGLYGIVAFGFDLKGIILCLTLVLSLLLPTKNKGVTIAMSIVIMCAVMFAFSPNQKDNIQISHYINTSSEVIIPSTKIEQTLFTYSESSRSIFTEDKDSVILNYTYYDATFNWVKESLKKNRDNRFYFEQAQEISDYPIFDRVLLKQFGASQYYCFEKGNQLLFVGGNKEIMDIIGFAKDKMKIVGN